MAKVYYMGREVNGRYSSFKSKAKKIVRFVAIRYAVAFLLVSTVWSAYHIGHNPAVEYAKADTASSTEAIVPAIVQALNPVMAKADVLNQLKNCESPDYKENDAPILLDSNNQMSIGLYMFQITTVQLYEKTLYHKDITRKEAVEIALDADQARALASDIIFKDAGKAIGNWFNCANRNDQYLIKEVKWIKKFTK